MLSKMKEEIFSFFPNHIKELFLTVPQEILENMCEIRFRVGQPIVLSSFQEEEMIKTIVQQEELVRLIENFSNNSIYSIQEEMNQGFLTIKGGHRIGISGTSILEKNEVKNIKYISSLNIRIAREVKNCSLPIFNQMNPKVFENTVIVSPPRLRKDYNLT